MRRYAIRRSLTVIPVLLGVSILVFSFVHLIPGDPAVTMLGERATPEKVAEVRARLGLDRPIHEQYLLYIGKAIRGDLGVSIVRGDPVFTDILRSLPRDGGAGGRGHRPRDPARRSRSASCPRSGGSR